MTEPGAMTKTPATRTASSSVRVRIAIAAMTPPIAIDPTSPMKTFAFGAFHHRNPTRAPTKAAETIARSNGIAVSGSTPAATPAESVAPPQHAWLNCQNAMRL